MFISFAGSLRLTFCGGVAGISLWIVIFPADVIKSRIQVFYMLIMSYFT